MTQPTIHIGRYQIEVTPSGRDPAAPWTWTIREPDNHNRIIASGQQQQPGEALNHAARQLRILRSTQRAG